VGLADTIIYHVINESTGLVTSSGACAVSELSAKAGVGEIVVVGDISRGIRAESVLMPNLLLKIERLEDPFPETLTIVFSGVLEKYGGSEQSSRLNGTHVLTRTYLYQNAASYELAGEGWSIAITLDRTVEQSGSIAMSDSYGEGPWVSSFVVGDGNVLRNTTWENSNTTYGGTCFIN
jgi:hypothetical protein